MAGPFSEPMTYPPVVLDRCMRLLGIVDHILSEDYRLCSRFHSLVSPLPQNQLF